MNIGYDGKRAFQNKTGLGNYTRSLIAILSRYYPQHHYHLFAPRATNLFDLAGSKNITASFPQQAFYKQFPSLWRSSRMVKDIQQAAPDIYHGVSNELPRGIQHTGIKTVVTVHDLIFERFPETYSLDERYVHRWKIKNACKVADTIIAISEQTRSDLIQYYKVPPEKIVTCYQSCNPVFERQATAEEKLLVKKRYQLPDRYFLFVSSIAPRKNLVAICKALILLNNKCTIPILVIGDGKKQKEEVKALMQAHGMSHQLIFLNELAVARETAFTSGLDFPAIYQQATALVYPSLFEGFGLPVLEALWSGTPVICSNTSSLPEVGGAAALYFSPHDHATLAAHLQAISTDPILGERLRNTGFKQALRFSPRNYADQIINVYNQLL